MKKGDDHWPPPSGSAFSSPPPAPASAMSRVAGSGPRLWAYARSSARVFVNGRQVAALHGRRLQTRLNLRGLPPGIARVTIFLRTRSGHAYVRTRVYRTCAGQGT